MEEKKIDRRVIKTKKAIKNAFMKLLAEKHISEITIKEIADVADINRKTFYNYYTGVHELLEELENDVVSRFEENIADFDFDALHPDKTFSNLSYHIEDSEGLHRKLFISKNNSHLKEKMFNALRNRTIDFLVEKYNIDKATLNVITIFISSGLMHVYEYYLTEGSNMSLEEVSSILSDIIENGIKNYLPVIRK